MSYFPDVRERAKLLLEKDPEAAKHFVEIGQETGCSLGKGIYKKDERLFVVSTDRKIGTPTFLTIIHDGREKTFQLVEDDTFYFTESTTKEIHGE